MLSVIGGGSWGTALAAIAARNNGKSTVTIYARNTEIVNEINHRKTNKKYLGDITLPNNIRATSDLNDVIQSRIIILAVPTQSTREICVRLRDAGCDKNAVIVLTAKGIENNTSMLLSEVAGEVLPNKKICALSGPSLAKEAAIGKPTLITLGGDATVISKILSSKTFSTQTTTDIIGVQICGAVKNVAGIAFGFALGMGCAPNTQAKLFTNALDEMRRVCVKLGGNGTTAGMACGAGDLYLSCSSVASRNTAFGYALAQNKPVDTGNFPEGYYTAKPLYSITSKVGIDLPICSGVYRMLSKQDNRDLVSELMSLT